MILHVCDVMRHFVVKCWSIMKTFPFIEKSDFLHLFLQSFNLHHSQPLRILDLKSCFKDIKDIFLLKTIFISKYKSDGILRMWVNRKKKSVKSFYFFDLSFTDVHKCRQKVPKSDFQSQFSMSKIIWIFPKKFFVEQYQFRSTFFVIDIFW